MPYFSIFAANDVLLAFLLLWRHAEFAKLFYYAVELIDFKEWLLSASLFILFPAAPCLAYLVAALETCYAKFVVGLPPTTY